MACSSCSTTSSPTYSSSYGGGCATTTSNSSNCVLPRRVTTPPVTPLVFPWVTSMRSAGSGQMVIANCTELNVLDAPFSGPVIFDRPSGKVLVSSGLPLPEALPDNFGCATETLSGYPAYGLTPGCADIGERPDRLVAFIRPEDSNTGRIYLHRPTCSSTTGLRSEMIPAELNPGTLPSTLPDNVKLLAFRRTGGSGECDPTSYQWYESDGVFPVADDDLPVYELPDEARTPADDATFRLAGYQFINGKWVPVSISNASFQAFLTSVAVSPINYLSPPANIADQSSVGINNQTFNIDLSGYSGYFANAREVQLRIVYNLNTSDQAYNVYVNVGGSNVGYAQVSAGTPNFAISQEATVPIPSNKILVVNYNKTIISGSNAELSRVQVFLEKFA